MQLVQASDAAHLSGLSMHQLREWCGRRGVVTPDVPPGGRGRHALYSWQTIISLRLLKSLQESFGVEVGAWKPAISQCQALLQKKPFPTLWGLAFLFIDMKTVLLTEESSHLPAQPFLCLPLDPHLEALASAFAMPFPKQLPLFAALAVSS